MVRYTLIVSLLSSASLLFGQLDSNSVTVTAARNVNLQPDLVVFGVVVESGLNTSLDDVLGAMQGSPITMANFTGVSSLSYLLAVLPPNVQPQPVPTLQWTFVLPAPLSKIKDTTAMLLALQQSLAKKNNGLKLSFSTQGTQISSQLQQSQGCSIPDLIADARAQAQKLADAGGLSVGTILAMSSETSTPVGNSIPALLGFASFASFPPSCSITVKFALGRF